MSKAVKQMAYNFWSDSFATNPDSRYQSKTNLSLMTETITGTSVANYKEKIAKHQDASSAYTRKKGVIHDPGYQDALTVTVPPSPKRLFGYTGNLPLSSPPAVQNSSLGAIQVKNSALSILKGKMSSDFKDFKSLLPLAEINETRQIVGSINDTLIDVFKAGANIQRDPVGAVRAMSKLWLTNAFGIQPLIGDLTNLGKSINDYLLREDFVKRYSAGFTDTFYADRTSGSSTTATGLTMTLKYADYHTIGYHYAVGRNFKVSNTADYTAARHFGVDSLNEVVPALWEATAFSWMVDYALNVQDFLEDKFSSSPGTSIYVDETFRQKSYCWTLPSFAENAPAIYKSVRSIGRPGLAEFNYLIRSPLPAIPSRRLFFRSFDEMAYRGYTKLTNIAAVAFRNIGNPNYSYFHSVPYMRGLNLRAK